MCNKSHYKEKINVKKDALFWMKKDNCLALEYFRLDLQDEGEKNSGMIITDEIGAPWFYKSFL